MEEQRQSSPTQEPGTYVRILSPPPHLRAGGLHLGPRSKAQMVTQEGVTLRWSSLADPTPNERSVTTTRDTPWTSLVG